MFEKRRLREDFSKTVLRLMDAGMPVTPAVYPIFERSFSKAATFMRKRRLTPRQGTIYLITNTIQEGCNNGALEAARIEAPEIYSGLRVLYRDCELALAVDTETVGHAFVVGEEGEARPFVGE